MAELKISLNFFENKCSDAIIIKDTKEEFA